MTDLASLYIKIDSGGAVTASKNLSELENNARKVESATASVQANFLKLASTIGIGVVAIQGLNRLLSETVQLFQKGFGAVEQYNTSISSLAAMVVTFSQRQKGMDLAGQWEEALRYSTQMIPVLENLAAKTLLSGQETVALANAFARSGVFLQANNEKQLESFTRLSNALPLMTQGQDIMRQINTEIRGLMTGQGEATSMLLTTLKAIDPQIEKHLKLWRAEGTVVEHVGDLLEGFGPATAILEKQWQAVKSTLDTTVTQILRGGMLGAYDDIIRAAKEMDAFLKAHKNEIIDGLESAWIDIKDAITACVPAVTALGNVLKDLVTLYNSMPDGVVGTAGAGIVGRLVFGATGGGIVATLYAANSALSALDLGLNDLIRKYNDADEAIKKFWNSVTGKGYGTQKFSMPEDTTKKDEFKFDPISHPDTSEAEKAAKRQAKIREQALAQILEDTRQNAYELQAIGEDQYNQDIYRIRQETEAWINKGVDQVAAEKWALSEISIAGANERERKTKERQSAYEDYKQFIEEEAAFSADSHAEAVNRILLEEQRKYEEIKRMQDEGGISPVQAEDATAMIHANTLAKMEEANMDYLSGQADFYSELAGYEENYRDAVYKLIEKEEKLKAKAYKDDVAAAKWARNEKLKFEEAVAKEKLGSIAEGMGATSDAFETMSQMYAEDSKEREKLHNIAMAFHAAEQAALLAQAIAAAVTAVATQGGGDPYTAFARIAAMSALMASLIATIGGSFGGGSAASSASVLPPSTVLGGAAGESSDSIQKSWELLKDTYDMEYRELRNIYLEMKDLNDSIKGLVDDVFRTYMTSSVVSVTQTHIPDEKLSAMQKYLNLSEGMLNLLDMSTPGLGAVSKWVNKFFNSVIESAWGHDKTMKVVAEGIKLTNTQISDLMAGQSVLAYSFATIKETTGGGWLHGDSSKYGTIYKVVAESTTRLFTNIYSNLGNVLKSLSESLGTSLQDVLNYTFEEVKIKIRRADTPEDVSEKINAVISDMGDKAAEALFGDLARQYQQVGEGMLETVTRLVIDKAVVGYVLKLTGQSFDIPAGGVTETRSRQVLTDEYIAWDKRSKAYKKNHEAPTKFYTEYYEVVMTATEKTIELSEALITIAGDIDSLSEAVSSYYDKFFTDTEKQTLLHEQLVGAMEDLNLVFPETRAEYRKIVEALDLNTEAGREAYVTMMQMAESADQYYSTLEEAASAATAAQEAYIESLKELSKTIDEWLANLNLSDISPVGSEAAWKEQYQTMLSAATAEGATSDTVTDFLNYATKFLTYEKTYGSDDSYRAIYEAVVRDVQAIQALTNTKIAAYAEGGLTSGISIAGERGREWVVPTYEPQRSRFLSDVGVNTDAIGQSIAKHINAGETGDIHISIQIDGREIGNVVAKQVKTNGDLQQSIRRIAA